MTETALTTGKGGRPKFEPTDKRRALVVRLVAAGANEETVARVLECSLRTLRRHFKDELRQGVNETTARIGFRVIQAAEAGDLRAAELFLRTRGRWSEKLSLGITEEDRELFEQYQRFEALDRETMQLVVGLLNVLNGEPPINAVITLLREMTDYDRAHVIAYFARPKGIENDASS